jgi:hypothetical protein
MYGLDDIHMLAVCLFENSFISKIKDPHGFFYPSSMDPIRNP